MYLIYGLYCKFTGKLLYIGQTKNTLRRRLQGHQVFIRSKMDAVEIMYVPKEDALEWEEYLIRYFDLLNNGLNKNYGGAAYRGAKQPPEMIAARVAGRAGYVMTEEHKKNIGSGNSVSVVCVNTGEVFPSTAAAARWCQGSDSKISNVCKGKRKSHKGYQWKYFKEWTASE